MLIVRLFLQSKFVNNVRKLLQLLWVPDPLSGLRTLGPRSPSYSPQMKMHGAAFAVSAYKRVRVVCVCVIPAS